MSIRISLPVCTNSNRLKSAADSGLRTAGNTVLFLLLLLLPSGAGAGKRYDPTTLVYPTFRHDLGIHHVGNLHLRIYSGNRHRFRQPRGIAVVKLIERDVPDKTGDDDELTVYGLNSGDHTIIYNTSETSIAVYGGKGNGEGEFLFPRAIAADPSGNVYVADTGNNRVVHLRYRGGLLHPVRSFTAARGDSILFRSPRGIALGSDGTLYVSDTGNNRVVVIDRSGCLERVIGARILRYPEAIALLDREEPWSYRKDDFLLIIERNGRNLVKFSLAGELLKSITTAGIGFPNAKLRGVAIDYYHQIYLTDEVNHQIHKLDSRLRPITSFGREGSGEKEFRSPFGIAVWRRFGQFFVSESTGAHYFWIGVDVLNYYAQPTVFRPGGRIIFTLTERAKVTLEIRDEKGNMVRSLAEERIFSAGDKRITWNGKNESGNGVPPGRYTVRIEASATYSSAGHFQKTVEFPITVG